MWEGRPATLNFLSDINERKRAEEELRESEARFRALFEGAGICIMLIGLDGKIKEVNAAALKVLGYRRKAICSMMSRELIHPDDFKLGANLHQELLKGKRDHYQVDKRYIRKDGQWIWGRLTTSLVRDAEGSPRFYIAIIEDITERRHAEQELQKREAELKVQAHSLEEVNVALRVLLKQRENDQKDLEEKVLGNVRDLVSPFFQELKKSRLDSKQMGYLKIAETNLNEIISPFTSKLSAKYLALTPKEIQIASLVKEGKTSKEIAELLNVSSRAIEFHRDNIRRKVGLKNKKANLRSYLLSLP
jgi:PAS domain S-box-containing protein